MNEDNIGALWQVCQPFGLSLPRRPTDLAHITVDLMMPVMIFAVGAASLALVVNSESVPWTVGALLVGAFAHTWSDVLQTQLVEDEYRAKIALLCIGAMGFIGLCVGADAYGCGLGFGALLDMQKLVVTSAARAMKRWSRRVVQESRPHQ
mmetsp:Transcript_43637/g.79563  ORF Transcript_43637/g.79563 Transcript_43637/m.79563 type:complete len:150 (-) Transcript_43637:113-562(-)